MDIEKASALAAYVTGITKEGKLAPSRAGEIEKEMARKKRKRMLQVLLPILLTAGGAGAAYAASGGKFKNLFKRLQLAGKLGPAEFGLQRGEGAKLLPALGEAGRQSMSVMNPKVVKPTDFSAIQNMLNQARQIQ